MGFDFIVIAPLLPSCCGFFFVFGCGLSFFGGLQHPPVDGRAAAGSDFGALGDGNECTSFYSTILNQNTVLFFVFFSYKMFTIFYFLLGKMALFELW